MHVQDVRDSTWVPRRTSELGYSASGYAALGYSALGYSGLGYSDLGWVFFGSFRIAGKSEVSLRGNSDWIASSPR